MSETTDRLSLPYLMPAQAQKHVTVNEALRRLDALVQARVLSRTLAAEPAGPAPGDAYILPAGATGAAWTGFAEHDLAVFQDGAWEAFPPKAGWQVFLADEAEIAVFDGAAWRTASELVGELQNLTRLGVGTVADGTNPFSAKLNAALWTALETGAGGTGDLRYTLNKQAAGNVLSLLFQSGWSGRAEIGLTGDEDFHFKVSPDGSAWTEALTIDRTSGSITLGGALALGHNQSDYRSLTLHHTATNGGLFAIHRSGSDAFVGFTGFEGGDGMRRLFFGGGGWDVADANEIRFYTDPTTGAGANQGVERMRLHKSGGLVIAGSGLGTDPGGGNVTIGGSLTVGAPTGGHQGAGTINAVAVYDDGTLLTDLVLEQAATGRFDPQRYVGHPVAAELEDFWFDPEAYEAYWRTHHRLPGMVSWQEAGDRPSLGEQVTRLVAAVETQAVLIARLNARLKRLET
ncbi:DUF2793 domain-containing protein [Marinicauda algicola]|uniref:DUF2793 domain-containing protein n=1 Tax=Marinicauda algicola TaxID=2029849 RepID=A0A4S2H3D5_9PROT|nr:DUF2793 domain-containing protein [Marinicauda algicola]TGY89762.1 DUF2793 domain-containing protein [Marinicauda algicola]